MKRLLAALLTLSMLVSIVPFSAFAESPGAVPETFAAAQESPGLDDETVQSIVSDPLVEGIGSIGKLLMNNIDEQNSPSSSENRVIGVTVSGSIATVEYVAVEDSDLVVAIYTDDSAEEMLASGTTSVLATVENSSSSFATVNISGMIPEYYTIKCYLLDKTEHAPLSKVYTDASHTQDIIDLDNATIDDFPENRSVNFDEQRDTNFAVVQKEVTLISSTSASRQHKNIVTKDDNENLIYQIENADEHFLSLKSEDIVVYPYAEGSVMVVKVKSISQSGDNVTIYGDDTLDLREVFEVMKLNGSADNEDFVADKSSGDQGISYEGLTAGLDETNAYDSTLEFSHTFKISSDDLKGDDGSDSDDNDDSGWSTSGSIDGTVSINIKAKLSFSLKNGQEFFSFSMPSTESIKISLTGSVKYKTLNLTELSVPISGVFAVGIAPKLVFSSTGKAVFETTRSQTVGFQYSTLNGTQDLSTAPTTETDFKLEGTLYVGLDLCPKAKVALANKLELVSLELQAEAGLELQGTMKHGYLESGVEKIHACKICFSADLNAKITFGIGLKFLFFHPKVSIPVVKWTLGQAYAAPDYHDFGWGSCPHVKYRVQLTLTGQKAVGTSVRICRTDKGTDDLSVELNEDNLAEIYLEAGDYTATATVDDTHYLAEFTLEDKALNVNLKAKEDEIASGTCGATGSQVFWKLDKNGTLTISGSGEMENFNTAHTDSLVTLLAPWFDYRNDILHIIITPGVTRLGNNAFDECEKLETVDLPTSVTAIGNSTFCGCASLTSITLPSNIAEIGNSAFFNCTKLATIKIPEGITKISNNTFELCSSLTRIELPNGLTTIGEYAFDNCRQLVELQISPDLKSISKGAFYGCTSLKKVIFAGTREQWNAIEIEPYNDPIGNATVYCESNITSSGNCGESLIWQLNEAGVLTISGDGEMPDYETGSAIQPEEWKTAQSLIIQDGVTKIGKYAFDRCTALTDVEISGTVKTIEDSAFFSCTSLENILLHDGIETIAASAFNGCSSLQGVVLPRSVTTIGRRAFQGATSLTHVDIMSTIVELPAGIFYHCNSLERVRLPQSIQKIDSRAFSGCDNLADIYFDGSSAEWKNIIVDSGNEALSLATIHCSDGDIFPVSSEENSISASTATGDDHSFAASFSDLTPGVSYVVIVSRSEIDPLAPENLIYINQFRASSSDYQQSFQTPRSSALTADDMTYVIASGIYSFDETPTPTPGGGSSSGGGGGGGGGGGAAVLIGVGAAAAITAGVIMMSPVEIKGRVVLADQTAVPGAKLSLLHEGKVVAQTTADENGSFSLKAKRGSYELTAAYTNADGQLIYKTIDIKAPAKDLTVTF